MKIKKSLNLNGDVYVIPPTKSRPNETDRWVLCDEFIQELLGITPSKVHVTVSDTPFDGAEGVVLSIVGDSTQRWNWINPSLRRHDQMAGMYLVASAVVKRIMGKRKYPFILYVSAVKVS